MSGPARGWHAQAGWASEGGMEGLPISAAPDSACAASVAPGAGARAARRLAAAALVAAVALAGCATRNVRDTLSDAGRDKVFLRAEKTLGGEVVPKGYDHPITISSTRLAHILSRIDIRTDADEAKSRVPAIPAEMIYELGEKLADALARATPDQEVVVIASRREYGLGVFNHDYITSFIAYVEGDQLTIRLYHADWKQGAGGEKAKIAEPSWSRDVMSFRVVPGEAMAVKGEQTLQVAWRDPIFRSPTAVRVTPTGRIVRRQVLMESEAPLPADDVEPLPEAVSVGDLSPDQLRDLADLEELRREGQVSEAEYRARRGLILSGEKLSEPPTAPAVGSSP